jgi:hypothetical protein
MLLLQGSPPVAGKKRGKRVVFTREASKGHVTVPEQPVGVGVNITVCMCVYVCVTSSVYVCMCVCVKNVYVAYIYI